MRDNFKKKCSFLKDAGSLENIEIMNKNLDANDVPVTEATNRLTAQETTELKNLVSSSRDPQVIASYLAAKSQQESLTEDSHEEDDSLDYFYHASFYKLSYPIDFNKSKEIGLHIGTEEQALKFNRKYLYKIGIDKSIRCLDIKQDYTDGYGGREFSNTLVYYGVMTDEQASELPDYIRRLNLGTTEEWQCAYSKVFRDLLLNAGYSAIRYYNRVEGAGYSLCVFDNSVIKSFELYKEKHKTYSPNYINDNLSEASYGGAYDIEDNIYFTKDDLFDFTDELIDTLHYKGVVVDLVDMYITDGNRLVIIVEDEDGNEIDVDEFIDMRKIRRPKDIYKYKDIFINDILSQYNEFKSFNEDLDEIPVIDRLNFINKRSNRMPGIQNINDFIDCLNAIGKDKFMVKETRAGSNLSLADLKDEWTTLKKKGWKWYTRTIPGEFLTYYVFEKINKGENMKENLVEDDLYQLKAEIEDEVKKYMISQGFEPDEVKDYSVVDIYFDSKERDTAIVEVRAELSYDGLFELGLKLNKVIADYDEDAYFEPVEPGITSAYIHNITPEKMNECSKQIKEDYEDTPNYINDLYEILIQAQVCIDKIRENYSSDVYNIIKLGIEQTLDEFMAHDDDGWTMYAAIKEAHKSPEEDDNYDESYDEDDENNNYPKNLPEQFYSLYDKLNGEFWTRKDELEQDIEEITYPKYSVEELNDEYVVITDPEDDMHALQVFNGGTDRTYVLDFNRIRYL